ncbi:hypothetical protein [Okeania sp. SIO3I5]|uniref:hypothetical protein n=1 Tax=Okeania sp. SIO3I5 TaxID=2607805 RepID=UPI0025CD3E4F|nr:hypothetical protein [Okeania sp. SIO3I5]
MVNSRSSGCFTGFCVPSAPLSQGPLKTAIISKIISKLPSMTTSLYLPRQQLEYELIEKWRCPFNREFWK